MTSQDQEITGSQIENSQVQLTQAERDAFSFLNSNNNQVTIKNIILQLFGQSTPPVVDWDWAHRLLEKKQLPEICKRLTDTLGRDRSLMQISLDQQLRWVGRSPLQAERHLQVQDQDRGILDKRQMLIETFGQDDIAGKLLILGTPGAGKTTALLSLAEQLVRGAIANPKTAIPVLFELSTWRDDKQSIRDWLIEQLYDLHGGDRKAKRYEHWLDQQVLLPLLDGLDELGLERQQKCTAKLNEFARHYPHLVVCCRMKEFEQSKIKLKYLNGSVCLEPLSDVQIQAYLDTIQQPELWSIIQSTPALHNLLESDKEGVPGLLRVPLFVTLASRVYNPQHPFQTKAELLGQYVDRQLSPEARESDRRKDLERREWAYKTPKLEPDWRQTQRTLRWLVQTLKDNNQIEFLIENIQPYYLKNKLRRWQYWLCLLVGNFLISGLITIVLYVQWPRTRYPISWSSNLSVGLLFGLLGSFILSTESKAAAARLLSYPLVQLCCFIFQKKLPRVYEECIPIINDIDFSSRLRLNLFSLKDFKSEVLYPLKETSLSTTYGILAPIALFIFAMHEILGELACWIGMKRLGAILKESHLKIKHSSILPLKDREDPRDSNGIFLIKLSFEYVRIIKLEGGLILNLIFNILIFIPVLTICLLFLVTSLISILLTEEIKESSTPNEGLEEALKFALVLSILFYAFSSVIASWQSIEASYILCVLGYLACCSYLSLIKHGCLRFVLWQSGIAPWNLARFLNYCVERKLLQRVGGRYRFLHRELLDHFAGQPPTV